MIGNRLSRIERLTGGPGFPSLRALAGKIVRFAIVSGGGLSIDFILFILLTWIGLSAAVANILSASAATAFVYFMSVSRIFSYRGRFVFNMLAAYGVYQAVAILAASYAVGVLAKTMSPPVLAKLAVLPVTFSANFLMMSWLTHRRAELAAERSDV